MAGCGKDSLAAAACGDGFNYETGAVANFGASGAATQVESLLSAAAAVHEAAHGVEDDLLSTCVAMADDLMIPAEDRAENSGTADMASTCHAVAEKISDIRSRIPGEAGLIINITPAVCTVDLDVAASCAAECDVTIQGDVEVECTGSLRGECSATCNGECSVQGEVACAGSCTGECVGTCDGICAGTGTSGECTTTCEGTCSGTCMGTCTSTINATCEGECSGSCSAEWDARCDGHADFEADADCQASCDAELAAEAVCTDPAVDVAFYAASTPENQAEIARLVDTLGANLPRFLAISERVNTQLIPSFNALGTASANLANTAADVGAQAAACVIVAAEVVADAALQVNASVTVTVEINASISTSN